MSDDRHGSDSDFMCPTLFGAVVANHQACIKYHLGGYAGSCQINEMIAGFRDWQDQWVKVEQPKTPLMEAASQGNTKLVRMLVEAGADVHQTCPKGLTACDYADLYYSRHGECSQYLRSL